MALFVLAILICVLSIVAFIFELRSEGTGVLKSARFWCGAGAFVVTLILFFVASLEQQKENIEKAVTAARQSAELEKVQNKSDHIIDIQKLQSQNQELQLEKQQLQLKGAENLAKSQDEQKEDLRRVIDSQGSAIQRLNGLTLNRNLLGIEVSFIPSQERWNKIAVAYRRIKSPEPDVSYINAAMIAERDGDHWRIDFDAAKVKERVVQTAQGPIRFGGNKRFHKLSTTDDKNKPFEDVLREASLGLRIEWGNGTATILDPTNDDYPSAIYVSRDKIGLILRPPLVLWNLIELRGNSVVTFYGQDYPLPLPASFTMRSLDPAVVLNQTIPLNWKRRGATPTPSYDVQMNRQISGPHDLNIDFRFFGPFSGGPYLQPRQKSNLTGSRPK